MRIDHLSADPGIPVFGTKGASVHVQEIVRAFRARGDDVTIRATRLGDHVPGDLSDIPVQHERMGTDSDTGRRERLQAQAADRIAQAVVTAGTDLVYERYSLFSTALAQVRAALDVPTILEVNAPLIEEQATHRTLVDADGAESALRAQLTAATTVVCVSDPVRDWVLHRGAGIPGLAERTITVPNGVNTDRIRPSAPAPGSPVVVFVGTLKPWHGVEDLVRAAAVADVPWRVRLVGDGPERGRLVELADQLGVQPDLRGAVPPEEIPTHLAGASVAVAPYPHTAASADQYFSPLKIYEYLAAGLPVVASAVGQIPSILDTSTGVLVPPSDPAALAAALDALAADPARRTALGTAGRERAVALHSWDSALATILQATGSSEAGVEEVRPA